MSLGKAFTISLSVLLLSGCLDGTKEGERTKSQLTKMAKDVGAEDALNTLGKKYQENVAPIVALGAAQVQASESLASARETGSEVIEGAKSVGTAVSEKAGAVAEYFPESEAELVGWIDGYTNSFAGWLRELMGGSGSLGFGSFGFGSGKFSIGSSSRKPHAPNSTAALPKGQIVSNTGGTKAGSGSHSSVSFTGLRR